MRPHIGDFCKIESGDDGISIVTLRLSTIDCEAVVYLIEELLHASQWLRTRCRVAEAIF